MPGTNECPSTTDCSVVHMRCRATKRKTTLVQAFLPPGLSLSRGADFPEVFANSRASPYRAELGTALNKVGIYMTVVLKLLFYKVVCILYVM